MSGNVVKIDDRRPLVERYCHCTFCDSPLILKLPETMPAHLVDCTECIQPGYIQFLEGAKK